MTHDTRLCAAGALFLFASSLIFLGTGVAAGVSAALATLGVVGLAAAAVRARRVDPFEGRTV